MPGPLSGYNYDMDAKAEKGLAIGVKSDYPTIDSVLEDTEKLLAMTTEMFGLLSGNLNPILKPDMRAEAGMMESPRESEPISGLNMRLQRFNRDLGILHREIAELRSRVDLS